MRSRPTRGDWAVAVGGIVLTEWVVWTGTLGTHVAGPRWLTAAWPLLLDVPLAWRRLYPLGAWLCILAGFTLHPLVTGRAAEGLELLYPIAIGSYAVATYASRRHAVIGLMAAVPAYLIHAIEDQGIRGNEAGGRWAAAFFGAAMAGVWLGGYLMRSRREAAELAERASLAEREAHLAVGEERARMARELHDIVSHNLSVVVLQASGARAGGGGERTLEKIERSGREALVEMRRLLGVLRDDAGEGTLRPQPGIAQLPQLAADVRAAGVPVQLDVDDGCEELAPAVQLNAYRIVQEALTNVLKHAGDARAHVHVRLRDDGLVVEVSDDGAVPAAPAIGGHGLIGMRERVALFGGELHAGPRPGGGFAVRATLPMQT
jgi:signal transduction histidine kinase